MAKKRRTLRGTGLNGKGQGADALLGNLRSQTQPEQAEQASPPEAQEPPNTAPAPPAEPKEKQAPAVAKAPKVQAETSSVSEAQAEAAPAAETQPEATPVAEAQPEKTRPTASTSKKSKAAPDKKTKEAKAAPSKKRPAARRAVKPESAAASAQNDSAHKTTLKAEETSVKPASAEAPGRGEKENAPTASPETPPKAEAEGKIPKPAPNSATPAAPAAALQSSTDRVQCTCYLEPELEVALDQVQALYALSDRDVEKSEIVNEALRRYLPLVSPKAGIEFTAPARKSSAMVKRTYNLDPALRDRLNRIQLQYRLKGRKIKKFVLVNEALHRYLPQVKEEFRHLVEDQDL